MNKKAMTALLAFWQGILAFLLFLALHAITTKSDVEKLFPLGEHTPFLVTIAYALYTVMQVFLLYAVLRSFIFPGIYEKDEIAAAKKGFLPYARHMLRLPGFLIGTAPPLVLGALLTPTVCFPSSAAFLALLGVPLTAPLRFLLSLAAGVIILVAELLAKRDTLRRVSDPKEIKWRLLFIRIGCIAAFVVLAFRVILLLLTHLISVIIEQNYRILPFLLLIPLIPLPFLAVKLIRAVHIRRKFYRNLARVCRETGAETTGFYRPYRSLLALGEQHTFILWHKGRRYDCQMLACLGRNNPLYIAETGDMEVRHIIGLPRTAVHMVTRDRPVLFEYTTRQHFAFEGEGGKKILILSPVAGEFYVGNTAKHTLADVGERIGEYTIYNGSGFLNAIERDCL